MLASKLSIPTVQLSPALAIRQLLKQQGPSGFCGASTAEQVSAGWKGDGKVTIITGCGAGLGLEALRVLAMRGSTVVAAVRSPAKMERTLAPIRRQYPSAKITVLPLDVSSLASVRAFAATFQQAEQELNILMLNAGCAFLERCTLSADGHEMQFATNHLGHHLLAQLLAPQMARTAARPGAPEGRVVVLSSLAHASVGYAEGIRFDALDSPRGYDPQKAYGQSKLCNVLFARSLARRMADQRVAVASCHPGVVMTTDIWRHALAPWAQTAVNIVASPLLRSIPEGAATQVYLAVAPRIDTGAYYQDVNLAPSSDTAKDDVMAERLWALSEKLCAV